MNDVIDKVLACPIRPQFVIASIGPAFDLDEAHRLVCSFLSEFGIYVHYMSQLRRQICLLNFYIEKETFSYE